MALPLPAEHYSTDLTVPNGMGPQGTKHEPFTAYLKVFPNPANGRRFESVRDIEKLAATAEQAFIDLSGDDSCDFTITAPVTFRPQFGQFPALLTVHGTITSTIANDQRLDDRTIDHGGNFGATSGPGSSPQRGNDPTTAFNTRVKAIKACIQTVVDEFVNSGINMNIDRLSVNNILFGNGKNCIHFPR